MHQAVISSPFRDSLRTSAVIHASSRGWAAKSHQTLSTTIMNKLSTALAGLALATAGLSAQAATFANYSFEQPPVSGETLVNSGDQGWFATAGAYRTTDAIDAPDQSQYALFGSGNKLYQNLFVSAGSYDVHFFSKGSGIASVYYAADPDGVYNDLYQASYAFSSTSFAGQTYHLNVASGASFRFFFENTSGADVGLDKVLMVTSAVPEPETYAMMLGGLALMGAVARRRKARA